MAGTSIRLLFRSLASPIGIVKTCIKYIKILTDYKIISDLLEYIEQQSRIRFEELLSDSEKPESEHTKYFDEYKQKYYLHLNYLKNAHSVLYLIFKEIDGETHSNNDTWLNLEAMLDLIKAVIDDYFDKVNFDNFYELTAPYSPPKADES
jgi:hypothetical protein